MKLYRCLVLITLTLLCNIGWANAPAPEVSGSRIHWPVVSAHVINVHRANGSYLESLPGNTISWDAPEPGGYFLVATNDLHWSEWLRSSIVTVEDLTETGAPVPTVANRVYLSWDPVSAVSINVHKGDGAYVESLPGDSSYWLPPQLGDYFLVAANEEHWQNWPRSKTITIPNPYTVDDVITGLTANIYSQTAAEVFWNRLPGIGIRYRVDKDDETVATIDGTSWFSDSFSVGSNSKISVTAVYPNGKLSNHRTTVVMTPAERSSDTPIINPNNYKNILKDVFGVYFGVQYREQLRHFATTTINAMRPSTFPSTTACVNGGQVTFSNPYILQIENCHDENAIYNGSFNIHNSYGDTDRISSNGLTITTGSNQELGFSGSLDGALSAKPGWYEASNMRISIIDTESRLEVQNANFNYTFPHLNRAPSDPLMFTPSFSGGFEFQSRYAGTQNLTVSTLERFWHSQLFTERTDWNYSEGILSVSADDGSRLVLNAYTGNEGTVLIQLAYNSVVEQFEQAWDSQWNVWRQFADL